MLQAGHIVFSVYKLTNTNHLKKTHRLFHHPKCF